MKKKIGLSLALACTVAFAMPAFAEDTQVSRPIDQNMDDDRTLTTVDETGSVSTTTAETPAATTEDGDININTAPAAAAPAEGAVAAKPPRSWPSNIRLIPTGGVASFTTRDKVDLENFDEGFTAGVLADFGGGAWVFETGILALNADAQSEGTTNTGAVSVDSWGIPLLGKLNFSGNPHSTVFLKAGVMPFQTSGDEDTFEVLGVAGIGGAIPLLRNTAITLEANYNRILDDGGDLGTYQGVAALAGLQFGL